MAISKVLLNDDLQIDLTDKTVSDENLQYGFTAHKADGQQVIGEAEFDEQKMVWCSITTNDTLVARSGTVSGDTVSFSPTGLDWTCCVTIQGLCFRWYQVRDLKLVCSLDYQITGLVSGGYVAVTGATFSTSSPLGNTTRNSYGTIKNIGYGSTGDLSGHLETSPELMSITTGTPSDTDYFGVMIFAYTGAGSQVQLSNIRVGFLMPKEDAIISRVFTGTYSNSEITVIRNGAFYSCTNLTGIDAPNASIVNAYAFCYTKLSDISLPAMTSSVPEAMCTGCSNLPSFENSAVTFIGSSAFQNCTSLSSVSFANVTFVSSQAFQGCTSLTDIYLPKVSDVGSSAFISTQIGVVTNSGNFPLLYHTGTNAFQSTNVSEAYLSRFTTINNYAFANCKQLTSVYTPKASVIYQYAFNGCTSLSSYDFTPVVSIGNYAFANTKISVAHLPKLNNYTQGNSFRGLTTLNTVVQELYVTNTTGNVFYGATSLAVYDGRGRIAGNDFNGCTALTTLILRSTETALVTLGSTNAFTGTPFASGGAGGTIYIPEVQYNHLGDGTSLDYKAASNWSTMDSYGTITWAKIEGSYYEDHWGDGTARSV